MTSGGMATPGCPDWGVRWLMLECLGSPRLDLREEEEKLSIVSSVYNLEVKFEEHKLSGEIGSATDRSAGL